jgi:hypothetical protein
MFQSINSAFACSESTKGLRQGNWCTKMDEVKTITISAVSQIQITFGLQLTGDLDSQVRFFYLP